MASQKLKFFHGIQPIAASANPKRISIYLSHVTGHAITNHGRQVILRFQNSDSIDLCSAYKNPTQAHHLTETQEKVTVLEKMIHIHKRKQPTRTSNLSQKIENPRFRLI